MKYSTFEYGRAVERLMMQQIMNTISCLIHTNSFYYSHRLKKITEIDLLVVTEHSIYSIECKGYTQALYGSVNSKLWTGVSAGNKTTLYNPVMQNFMHIRSLRNLLYKTYGSWVDIKNIVLLLDSVDLNTDTGLVMKLSDFLYTARVDANCLPKIYDKDEMSYRITRALKEQTPRKELVCL